MSRIAIQKPQQGLRRKVVLLIAIILSLIAAWFTLLRSTHRHMNFRIWRVFGDVEVWRKEEAKPLRALPGIALGPQDRIHVGPKSQADLLTQGNSRIRIKENSLLEMLPSPGLSLAGISRLRLLSGHFFVLNPLLTEVEDPIEIHTLGVKILSRKASFELSSHPLEGKARVRVLKDVLTVSSQNGFFGFPRLRLKDHESLEINPAGKLGEIQKLSNKDWEQLRELYDMLPRREVSAVEQMDLAKKAGSLFEHSFDHGSFYDERTSYANREFMQDPSEAAVYLQIDYDVFPKGAFSGMYVKFRGLDLSRYTGLMFHYRKLKNQPAPLRLKIEWKYKSSILRTSSIRHPKIQWQEAIFPWNFPKETPADELTLVFQQDLVGEGKRGVLQLSDFQLIPRLPPVKEVS